MTDFDRFGELLAIELAAGASVKTAAETVGCSISSAYQMSRSEHVRLQVAAIRSALTRQAVGKLTSAAALAVDTIVELLAESQEPSIRLKAAGMILANLRPLSELAKLREQPEAPAKSSENGNRFLAIAEQLGIKLN